MGRPATNIGVALTIVSIAAPVPAFAHAFGARYDLPLPLWLWLVGAGAVVALSFTVLGLFVRHGSDSFITWRVDLTRVFVVRWLADPGTLLLLRVISVGLFLLIVTAGFLGDQTTTKNIAPVLVWVIWWVGLAYVSALLGDVWRIINPWSSLFALTEILVPRFGDRRLEAYPTALIIDLKSPNLSFRWR